MTWRQLDTACFDKILVMILATVTSLRHLLGWIVSAFSSRGNLVLENLCGSPKVDRQMRTDDV
jgi:hypothetical protein